MKEIKSIASFLYKKRIFLLFALFLCCTGLQLFWGVKATGDNRFFLLHEDEVIYYCSAKLFAETNSVQAESCIEEKVSPIGGLNWYGPGYHAVYGTILKLVHDDKSAFPKFHLVLALATLGLIFLFPVSLETRLLLAITLSLTHQFSVYTFSFFPESLVIILATVLTLLLALHYKTTDAGTKMIYLVVFIVCTLLFMLCRVTFIFWLAGIVALAGNRREFLIRSALFIAGVVFSLVYMKLFIAPPWAPQMHKIDLLYTFSAYDFIKETVKAFLHNLLAFVTPGSSVLKVMLGLVVSSVIVFFVTRSKIILAGLLICLCIIGSMMAYYAVDDYYFIKQTGMLVPLLLFVLIEGMPWRAAGYSIMAIIIMVFPSPYKKINSAVTNGKNAYNHYEANIALEKAFYEIPAHIAPESAVILWDYRQYDYGYSAQALLPFATRDHQPIMYTTNIVESSASAEDRFRLHGRVKVHYILSRYALPWNNVKEVHRTEFYYLYELLPGDH